MKAKIWNYQVWIKETHGDTISSVLTGALLEAGFHVIDYIHYRFKPHGFTALWLLGESHLAVHTFPEENKSYVELSSCNKKYYKVFKKQLKAELTIVKNGKKSKGQRK